MTARGRDRALSVCVLCGSADSPPQHFVDTARHLGEEIGRRGHRLLCGGTPVGLMGVVARAVRDSGGLVVGVVPRGLFDHLLIDRSAGELVVADTLGDRKAEMVARSDAFIVLPGGYGTLEELVEVLALCRLGPHTRPILLLNVDNFWEPLLQQTRQMVTLGFAHASEGVLFLPDLCGGRLIPAVPLAVPSSPSPDGTNGLDRSRATCYTGSKPSDVCGLQGGTAM